MSSDPDSERDQSGTISIWRTRLGKRVRTKRCDLVILQPNLEWVEINPPDLVLQEFPVESSRIIGDFVRQLRNR